MGVEINEGIATSEAFEANFTNEWGVQGTIRFLKNIMGMWLIQEVSRMLDYQYSYPEISRAGKPGRSICYIDRCQRSAFYES